MAENIQKVAEDSKKYLDNKIKVPEFGAKTLSLQYGLAPDRPTMQTNQIRCIPADYPMYKYEFPKKCIHPRPLLMELPMVTYTYDAEGLKKKEENQTAGTIIHTVVETPHELAAWLAEEDKEIQVLALIWGAEGVLVYYTAEAIKNVKEKGLNDRQIFINFKKKGKTKAHQETKK
uniref:Uncharacterized protein n=1 Tax=Romanomermis culicivorax TaxID=13658 RepID=A0A915HFD6_ROMCU